ncbi:hypothetical protein HPB51_024176 [Rhipicephalus microplus]|uniref:Uncharacterized protein n=1 Tax=Rhipicephalus microplus TaxID=6941 RepID=A0A9J6DY63_RHIMP|nr:hypothetical protein HPB51_024176 [Rhipicephalus microplus]
MVASANAASLTAAADADAGACSSTLSPPVTRSTGLQRGHKRPKWQLQPLLKPKATDFVIVLKPRTQRSLAAVIYENGAGSALIAHLRATAKHLVNVVMVRHQNFILVYTSNSHLADNFIAEFAVPSAIIPVSLLGYLRADTQGTSYGVVTVGSSDTETALRESLYWPNGEITHVVRLDTSNKVLLTFSGTVKPRYVSYVAVLISEKFYNKTVQPAVGAAPLDIDPTPVLALNQAFAASAERQCHSRMAPALFTNARPGALCVPDPTLPGTGAVRSATGPLKPRNAPPEGQAGPKNGKRQRPRKPQKPGSRAPPQGPQPSTTNPVPSQQPGAAALGPFRRGPAPDGSQAKGPTAGPCSPDPPKPNLPSPGHKSAGQGDTSWAARV